MDKKKESISFTLGILTMGIVTFIMGTIGEKISHTPQQPKTCQCQCACGGGE